MFLPNKKGYAIAVFVTDSGYGMVETEKIIADISEIVHNSFMLSEMVMGEYENKRQLRQLKNRVFLPVINGFSVRLTVCRQQLES